MEKRVWLATSWAALIWLVAPLDARAAPRIEFELAADATSQITGQQSWYKVLTELKVDDLRIREPMASDKIEFETRGTKKRPIYKVKGALSGRNELIVPGAKFTLKDRARLTDWIERLRKDGPAAFDDTPDLPFGLKAAQLVKVHTDLARKIDFDTQEMKLDEAIAKVGESLDLQLVIDKKASKAIADSDVITDELRGMSSGSALACLLRPAGLVLEPRQNARHEPELAVKLPTEDKPCWPIGWAPEKPQREILPALFEFLNVEIDEVPLAEAMEEIGKRLEVPLVLDQYSMVRLDIDPAKIDVTLPAKKTTYGLALRKILFQAKLKYELRVDEAGKPLLWITTLKEVKD